MRKKESSGKMIYFQSEFCTLAKDVMKH